jgi:hypothetical protein
MIQVAAGSLPQMLELESELLTKGYKEVGHQSKIGPMQYSKNEDFASGKRSISLTWNDPGGS